MKITGKRNYPAPEWAAKVEAEKVAVAEAPAPRAAPRTMFDDAALARERARRPRQKRGRQREKELTIRTSHAMFVILRRLAAATGTDVTVLVNAAILTAYAQAS